MANAYGSQAEFEGSMESVESIKFRKRVEKKLAMGYDDEPDWSNEDFMGYDSDWMRKHSDLRPIPQDDFGEDVDDYSSDEAEVHERIGLKKDVEIYIDKWINRFYDILNERQHKATKAMVLNLETNDLRKPKFSDLLYHGVVEREIIDETFDTFMTDEDWDAYYSTRQKYNDSDEDPRDRRLSIHIYEALSTVEIGDKRISAYQDADELNEIAAHNNKIKRLRDFYEDDEKARPITGYIYVYTAGTYWKIYAFGKPRDTDGIKRYPVWTNFSWTDEYDKKMQAADKRQKALFERIDRMIESNSKKHRVAVDDSTILNAEYREWSFRQRYNPSDEDMTHWIYNIWNAIKAERANAIAQLEAWRHKFEEKKVEKWSDISDISLKDDQGVWDALAVAAFEHGYDREQIEALYKKFEKEAFQKKLGVETAMAKRLKKVVSKIEKPRKAYIGDSWLKNAKKRNKKIITRKGVKETA